jgi:AcrR family transcriptional regulator
MARPREFDEQEALEKALTVFWTQGFDGTSIDDLVHATGLGRASLYNAFGDKERMFARVIDHYLDKVAASEVPITDDEPVERALVAMFDERLGALCPKSGPKGCFLLACGTAGGTPAFAHEALARSIERTRDTLEALLRRGQKRGEVDRKADTRELARFLLVVLHGMSTSARAGVPASDLKKVAHDAISHVVSRRVK